MPSPSSLPTSGLIAGASTGRISHAYVIHAAVNGLTALPLSTKTANYTLTLADSGEMVETNSASALTITVPPNSAVAFPVGTVIALRRYGTGTLAVAAGTGVTIRTASTLTARAQYSEVGLHKRGTDEWVLSGDLS